ncbi:MAG: sodium/solute symporter [Gemmatimonadota bacterium]|nr:sodium/solute symporter [Gemmatimonadota bacterium]
MENGLAVGKLAPIDVTIIVIYLLGITVLGSWIGRFIKNDEDFFLAGRRLPWWAIGMSMVVSDIGALELIGLCGAAWASGIMVANFDWIGCIPAMIIAAFIFIPYYYRAGVFTVPEFLGRRYNQFIRSLVAFIWGTFMIFMLGNFFYAAASAMHELCGWEVWFSVLVIALVVGIYTFFGGLAAVVYLDSIQCVILFAGSFMVLYKALHLVGGYGQLVETVGNMGEQFKDHFHLLPPADTPSIYSWSAILFGLTFVLSPAYWIGNQAIVQRNLGAKSEYDAKKSVLWGAFLKLFIPVILLGPGLAAVAMPFEIKGENYVYPTLMHQLLPPGMVGLVFAAFLAALLSSVDSYLNSAATLWTKDIYQKFIRPNKSNRHYMWVGKWLTAAFVVLGVALYPVAANFKNIFEYMQTMLSIFQGPLFAIILLGMVWRRANATGAMAGLFMGVLTSVSLFWVRPFIFLRGEQYLYQAWWGFVLAVLATVVVSLLTRSEPEEKIKGLVYSSIVKEKEGGDTK